MRCLTIDGMRSPSDLGLSAALQERISRWVARGAEALDAEGLAIARLVSALLPGSKVDCFSDAKMITLLP